MQLLLAAMGLRAEGAPPGQWGRRGDHNRASCRASKGSVLGGGSE